MKRAAFYVRVSTDRQEQEQTIDTQINEILSVIEKDGNVIDDKHKYMEAGYSGSFISRPQLDILRSDAKNNEFDILYVYDKGRLSRKFLDQEILIEEFKKTGVEFNSLHDINAISPEEIVMSQVMGVFHEYERVKISERFRIAKLNKVRSGKLLGYNPAYGYSYTPIKGHGYEKQNGSFEIIESEAEVIRKIFNWVADDGLSTNKIIKRLYDEGISPRKGKRDQWTAGPINRLLRNESYIGKHYYNKTESIIPKNPTKDRKYHQHTDKTSRKMKDRTDWLEVETPRIVTDKLFERVQQQLKKNAIHSPRNAHHSYLLRGSIWCTCGTKRTGEGARGHYYYRCTQRLAVFPDPPTCNERGINSEVIDSTVWDILAILLTEPKLLSEQYKIYVAKTETQHNVNTEIDKLNDDLSKLKNEESRYVGAYGRGSLDEVSFDEAMRGINKRKIDLTQLINSSIQKQPIKLPEFNGSDLAKAFKELLSELEFEEKLTVVHQVIDKVIATKETVTLCGNIPLLSPTGEVKAEYEPINRNRRPA
ncbi:MAG: Site-specific recombinase, invertase Pin [Candidatus Saccharibacteria bacterium]|nr:Site-specific recombinase, invertase Pin [Candidatus Saccharibacteria bacterium]